MDGRRDRVRIFKLVLITLNTGEDRARAESNHGRLKSCALSRSPATCFFRPLPLRPFLSPLYDTAADPVFFRISFIIVSVGSRRDRDHPADRVLAIRRATTWTIVNARVSQMIGTVKVSTLLVTLYSPPIDRPSGDPS